MFRMRNLLAVAVLVFVVGLITLPALMKLRVGSSRDYCREHQRQLWTASQNYRVQVTKGEVAESEPALPPGTIPLLDRPAEERLSWFITLLPHLDQTRMPVPNFAGEFIRTQGWELNEHREVGKSRLPMLLCPANPAFEPQEDLAVTQYVGLAGLAPDGAKLSATSPRAGAFRYDSPTLLSSFQDGLSETAMLAEVSRNLGGWIRGGSPTVRDLDVNDAPLIGAGRPFGGLHPGGMNLLFADGSSRFLTERTSPFVLQALFTLAGGSTELFPD